MTNNTSQPLRIGNAQAFWGDRNDAAIEMLSSDPTLDYITLDYLAEVSMSILAAQRERDPHAGFARDVIDVVRSLAPYWAAGGCCRMITNAGGLNPQACAAACREALESAGCRSLRIATVSGDDVLETLRSPDTDASTSRFTNLDTGQALTTIRDSLVTANAYLGAAPIVDALAAGVDLVITGRVADPSLCVAPCVHHFGWRESDLDLLAGATVAGHLIECGTQVTGGISTDWLDISQVPSIGFPIVEVYADGSCIVTKTPDSGGCVSLSTVKEQLVYEIGDPNEYLSPDVTVSFTSLQVQQTGDNRVRVWGAQGHSPPDAYKVSATYRDGWRAAGTLTIVGRDAMTKSQRLGELILRRVQRSGEPLRDSVIERFGNGFETVLRVAVESETQAAAERFARELMPMITAGPQGTTGYAEGRPRVHNVIRYWPCLIPRSEVRPSVETLDTQATAGHLATTVFDKRPDRGTINDDAPLSAPTLHRRSPAPTTLYDLAHARSGDKGIHANVGIIARRPGDWPFLCQWLTADRVAEFLGPQRVDSVVRYELPNLQALNFILHGILRRGLQNDAQGKTLGQILLEIPIPVDAQHRMEVETPSVQDGPLMSELILIESLQPGITVLTLNRPERRNALSSELLASLSEAIDRISLDAHHRVLILRGAGPVFCSGLDLREAAEASAADAHAAILHRALVVLKETPLITIAVVQGGAFAGGGGLMAACDLVIAGQQAKIGFPEAHRGLLPAMISEVLRHRVREGDLRELFLVGEAIDAARAQEMGLVQRVVPEAQLAAAAADLARSILLGGPETVRQTKRLINDLYGVRESLNDRQLMEIHLKARCSPEATEGLTAFAEKRTPDWS